MLCGELLAEVRQLGSDARSVSVIRCLSPPQVGAQQLLARVRSAGGGLGEDVREFYGLKLLCERGEKLLFLSAAVRGEMRDV